MSDQAAVDLMTDSLNAMWKKRVALLMVVSGLVSSVLTTLGAQVVWPRQRFDSVNVRMNAFEAASLKQVARTDSVVLRLDSLARSQATGIYLTCEILTRVNPAGAVVPRDCSRRSSP